VWDLVQGAGLGRYYALKSQRTAPPPDLRRDTFAWFERLLEDQPSEAGAPRRLTLDLQGVHCAACVWLLQELFRRFDPGVDLRINPSLGRAVVAWDPRRGDLVKFLSEAESFGYRFGPPRRTPVSRSRGLLGRLAVCAAGAMNVMIFSLSYYFGLAPADGALYSLFGWLNFAIGTIVAIVGGSLFFRSAWQGVRRRLAHLDLPISLGIALAWTGSVWGWIAHGPEHAYFDSVAIFVTLMVFGRWLQERLLERNRRSLLSGGGIAALTTRRFAHERLEPVPATTVAAGDEIWVVPGDLVPVDGTLLEHPARVSLDWIDGESRARDLAPGGPVPAGAFNAGERTIRICATQPFGDSRLNDLLPARTRSPRRGAGGRWWHRVSTVYVMAVLGLAAAAFLAWLPQGAGRALQVTISVLVVTCPCALGLATPLARDLVHGALRRRGVFVRHDDFVDRALDVRKVLFDKTGTLTLARLVLTDDSAVRLARLSSDDRSALLGLVAQSNHPVSRCLARELTREESSSPIDRDAEVREEAGKGLECRLDGRTFRLGRPGFAGPDDVPGKGAERTRAVLARDGEPVATFAFLEDLRPDAAREVSALEGDGYEIHVLSGDDQDRVDAAARRLGIVAGRAQGRLAPEAKAALVRELDSEDTLMVGDGLNDGPSFDVAHCAGTPAVDCASLSGRSDFYFLGAGLDAVRSSLSLARRLRRVVRDNLVIAGVYNAAALTLCFAGVVTPVVAAVLMPASSVAVVALTSLRLSERRLRWT
jgi:Cu2+-exporting ATPase